MQSQQPVEEPQFSAASLPATVSESPSASSASSNGANDNDTPPMPPGTLPHFTPVPRLRKRANGWCPDVQRRFIEGLAETGSVESACRKVGRSVMGAYHLRRHEQAEEFRQAWEAALAIGIQKIEDVAMERALNGVEMPVYSYGKMIGTRRVYNDRLLMFLLRNRASHRFSASGSHAFKAPGQTGFDQTGLDRLKQRWRKEWQEERDAKAPSPAEIRASIDRKIANLRHQIVASASPAAVELEIVGVAQRRADEASGWSPARPYEPFAAKAAELLPRFIEEVRAEWPPLPTWTEEDEAEFLAARAEDEEEGQAGTGPIIEGDCTPAARTHSLKDRHW